MDLKNRMVLCFYLLECMLKESLFDSVVMSSPFVLADCCLLFLCNVILKLKHALLSLILFNTVSFVDTLEQSCCSNVQCSKCNSQLIEK